MAEHIPVWASRKSDPIRFHWLGWLILVDALYGGINMFGRTDSASQAVLRDVAPIPAWYVLLPIAAVLLAVGLSKTGGAVGMFAWLFLLLASAASIKQGTALSYGGPILLALPCGFHFLVILDVGTGADAERERRQRQG